MLLLLQNMLFEIEQKVSYLSELSVHSESLLMEGRGGAKGEAEQLTCKLHSLKGSLMELQQMLQDKQVDIQVRAEVTTCVSVPPPTPLLFCACPFCCAVLHCAALVTASMVVLCKH